MGHGVEVLNLLAEKHNDWINVVKSFGASKEVAEDVVQDMYIKNCTRGLRRMIEALCITTKKLIITLYSRH